MTLGFVVCYFMITFMVGILIVCKRNTLFVQLCFEKVPDLLALDLIIILSSLVGNPDLNK